MKSNKSVKESNNRRIKNQSQKAAIPNSAARAVLTSELEQRLKAVQDDIMAAKVAAAAIRSIISWKREKNLFDAMELVAKSEDEGPGNDFAIGYVKGRLVYCDGKTYRPITLPQSAKAFYKVMDTGCWKGDFESQARWFNSVAKALSKGKAAR